MNPSTSLWSRKKEKKKQKKRQKKLKRYQFGREKNEFLSLHCEEVLSI